MDEICDIIIGSIIKRKADGSQLRLLVVIAEGLIESLGEKGLLNRDARGPVGNVPAKSSATTTVICAWAKSNFWPPDEGAFEHARLEKLGIKLTFIDKRISAT